MDNTIMDNMYQSVEIIEEIKDLNQRIDRFKKIAVRAAYDMHGDSSHNVISFKAKDMKGYQKDISIHNKKKQTNNANFVRSLLETGAAVRQIDSGVEEYAIHDKHTDNIVLHLDPSESLKMLDLTVKILEARKDKLIELLKSTFPGYKPGSVAGLEGGESQ